MAEPSRASLSGQDLCEKKWQTALVLGLFFFLLSSSCAYYITSSFTVALGGIPLAIGGPNLAGLLVHSLIFVLLVRLYLW